MKSLFIILTIIVTVEDGQPTLVEALQSPVAEPLAFGTEEDCHAALIETMDEDSVLKKEGKQLTKYVTLGTAKSGSVSFISRCLEIFP